jgi:hypothetical protein
MLHIFAIYLSQSWCLNVVFKMGLELLYVNFLHIQIAIWIKSSVNLIFDSQWNRYSYRVCIMY